MMSAGLILPQVTILFVLIVIDDSAHSMDPKKTLSDLNQWLRRDLGVRVQDIGFRVQDLGFRV